MGIGREEVGVNTPYFHPLPFYINPKHHKSWTWDICLMAGIKALWVKRLISCIACP